MKFRDEDISFVVQGYLDKVSTPKCIKSLRRLFPKSEIIFSTWQETDASSVEAFCDEIVYTEDPGGVRTDFFTSNLLRQLVSTQAGLKKVSRKYCMKLRGDLIFKSKDFLNYYDQFPRRDEKYQVFEERVIFTSFFFKKFLNTEEYLFPTPYHFSDWLSFGLSKDVRFLWEIPLPEEPKYSLYFGNCFDGDGLFFEDLYRRTHQVTPEQYLGIECLRKKFPNINFPETYKDFTDFDCDFYEKVVANNLIILDPTQMRMYCDKNFPFPYKDHSRTRNTRAWFTMYDFLEFNMDYKKYCFPEHKIPLRYRLFKKVGSDLGCGVL